MGTEVEIKEDQNISLTVTLADLDPLADRPLVVGGTHAGERQLSLTAEVVSTTNSALLPNLANYAPAANDAVGLTQTMILSPAADQHGEAVIRLTVSDGILADQNTHQFKLKVLSVNDEPSFVMGSDVTVAEDPVGAGFAQTDPDPPASGRQVTHAAWATHISGGTSGLAGTLGDESTSSQISDLTFILST